MNYRSINQLGLSLVFAAGLPIASAQSAAAPPKASPAPKTDTASKPAAKPQAPGMVAFKDPVTGQIRQPDASEIGDLFPTGPAPSNLQVGTPEVRQMSNGGKAIRLDDSFMTSLVVTKTADGKLSMECVEGAQNAATHVAAPKPTKVAAKKEALDEK